VEGVEEAFLQRNYGNDFGELYKPDSMNFGGGRGNGKGFRMEDFMEQQEDSATSEGSQPPSAPDFRQGEMPDMDFSRGERPDMGGMGSSDVKLQYVD